MTHIPGQPLTAVVVSFVVMLFNGTLLFSFWSKVNEKPNEHTPLNKERIEIQKLRQGDNLILGFSIGGGIDQDPAQNPFSQDKSDKGIYVTRITPGGPADEAGLRMGDKILQVNGWDMTMVTHDQARKRLTKKSEDVVRLLVTRKTLEEVVKQSMGHWPRQ